MDPNKNNIDDLGPQLAERLKQLPKVVREAIASADVEKRLRALSDTHKLHVDQWQSLENEVMLSLLGFQKVDDLEKNIKKEVGVTDEAASALAADISKIVFEPIRQELERELEHPDAQTAVTTGVEDARTQILSDEHAAPATTPAPAAVAPIPATPPAPAPDTKAVRAPISEVYKPGETSLERKDVHSDPYRETP